MSNRPLWTAYRDDAIQAMPIQHGHLRFMKALWQYGGLLNCMARWGSIMTQPQLIDAYHLRSASDTSARKAYGDLEDLGMIHTRQTQQDANLAYLTHDAIQALRHLIRISDDGDLHYPYAHTHRPWNSHRGYPSFADNPRKLFRHLLFVEYVLHAHQPQLPIHWAESCRLAHYPWDENDPPFDWRSFTQGYRWHFVWLDRELLLAFDLDVNRRRKTTAGWLLNTVDPCLNAMFDQDHPNIRMQVVVSHRRQAHWWHDNRISWDSNGWPLNKRLFIKQVSLERRGVTYA